MAENLLNSKIGHERQKVFLGVERLVGVQSVETNQNFGLAPLSYLGIGTRTINFVPRQEQSNSFSINSYLINKDYFLSGVTGNVLFNMYIMRDKNDFSTTYSLISGYFNEFTCDYSIGNVPQITTTFTVLRDAGIIPTGNLPYDSANQLTAISTSNVDITGNLLIPYTNSIDLNIDTFTGNRLQSFNLNVRSNKVPIYNAGSRFPKRVEIIYPIDVQLNCSFEQGTYTPQRLRNYPQSGVTKNLTLSINDYSTNQNICTYSFNNLNLINESYSTSINNNILVNQSYSTKIYG